MNAKGIKFLAVLAVLAMAFAAFAVMTDTEQNSAAIPEEVTTVSTEADFRTAITGDKEFNVKLGADITVSSAAKAYLVKSAGVIDFNGHTLKVTAELSAVELKQKITFVAGGNDEGLKSIIVNESAGLTLKDTSKDGKGGIINAAASTGTSSYKMAVLFNAPNGVMTIDSGSYTVDNGTIEFKKEGGDTSKTYWYTVKNLGTMTINGGYIAGMNHAWNDKNNASGAVVNGWDKITEGMTTAKLTMNGGTIAYGLNSMKGDYGSETIINGGEFKDPLQGFMVNWDKAVFNAVTLTVSDESKAPTFYVSNRDDAAVADASEGEMVISNDFVMKGKIENRDGATFVVNGTLAAGDIANSGILTGTGKIKADGTLSAYDAAKGNFGLVGPLDLTILEGAKVPADVIFAYVDQYGDTHSFKTSQTLTVQMGDFHIYAEENNLTVDGTALMDGAADFLFTGNVWLCGTIYTAAPGTSDGQKLSIGNSQGVDVKVEMFQTVGSGEVTLKSPVLVVPNSTFNVGGKLIISNESFESTATDKSAVLKVADGAVVKAAGTIKTVVAKEGYIWNAGSVFAPVDGDEASFEDSQLVRVYMNSVAGTGLFYKGSVVYDGKETTKPLEVAYGAYLDITGKSKVNITSGQTYVENPLYKYYTMTIATFDSTIALNVDYDNYYAPAIDLLKKAAASAEKSGKYATYRGVVWETADSAVIQINVPEEYKVKLVDTITETDVTVESKTVKVPTLSGPIASGIKLTDQFNRVITPDTNGIVKLVYGYQYTIEGANATSKYKFIDYFELFEDLDPKSKTKATFTMVRDPTVLAFDVNATDKSKVPTEELEFGVLQITEGYATKVNVDVTIDSGLKAKMTDGQVFMYYKVGENGQEIPVTYVATTGSTTKTVITGIYTNDELYFKAADVDFYKYQFGTFPTDTGKAWKTNPAVIKDDDTIVVIPTEGWTAVAGIVGDNGKLDSKGEGGVSLPVVLKADADDYTFAFDFDDAYGEETPDQKIVITWEKASPERDKTTQDIETSDTGDDLKVRFYADEVVSVYWAEIQDARQKMTVNDSNPEVVIEKNEKMTVPNGVTAQTITLTITKIKYAIVENKTDTTLTVSDGNFTNTVEPGKTAPKGVEVVTGSDNKSTSATVKLTLEGKTVVSWSYKLIQKTATTTSGSSNPTQNPPVADTTSIYDKKVDVVGESAVIEGIQEGDTIQIISVSTILNPYIVKTQPAEHAKFGDYSRVGHMGDRMFVYASASEESWDVDGVNVYYENPEKEGFPDYARGIYKEADLSEDGKYWTYTMPAENVVLMIKEVKDAYDVTIVDQAGEQQGDKISVARGTTAQITIPAKEGMTVSKVEATPAIADLVFKDGVATFTMPENNVTLTATYEESAYSKNVLVTIGQEKNEAGIKVVLFALDGKTIASGKINLRVSYTTVDEFGEVISEYVETTIDYTADNKTADMKTDVKFIQLLGDNYNGAFAVDGSFTLGAAEGELSTTAYTPVEA